MGIWTWLRTERATGSGLTWTGWSDVAQRASRYGWIDRELASGLPGVGRGVDLVAAVVGSLRPDAVKFLDDVSRPLEVLHRPALFVDPDPQWHGPSTWLSAAVADEMWDGNFFARHDAPDRLGYPTRLPVLPPSRVSWGPSPDPREPGQVYLVDTGEGRVAVPPGQMLHAAVNVPSGARMGRGILARYQRLLQLMLAVEDATFTVMRDGKPVGVLTADVDMTGEELLEVKDAFIAGVRRDGIAAAVRARFEPVSWSSADLALIPARELNLRLAADITGVPPYLLGVPSESRVYSNMESEWSNFVRVTVQRYVAPLQDALTDCLPRGQTALFDFDELTRPDAATRWANHRVAYDIGAATVAEIRQAERMGPLDDGGGGS